MTALLTTALFAAAAARAGGALTALDVSGCGERVAPAALIQALGAHGDTLRTANVCDAFFFPAGSVHTLLSCLPALRSLELDVSETACAASSLDAQRLLRAAPSPSASLVVHVHALRCLLGASAAAAAESAAESAAALHSLAADVTAHAPLTSLTLRGHVDGADAATDAALVAVLDAAAARRLRTLCLDVSALPAGATAALTRLLRAGGLAALSLGNAPGLPEDDGDDDDTTLAAALRACPTITSLSVAASRMWAAFPRVAPLLHAASRNGSMRSLCIADNALHAMLPATLCALMGALMADVLAPAEGAVLTALDVSGCALRDEGLAPLLAAVASGRTRLRALRCGGNGLSDAAARAQLLPAARAHGALRLLEVGAEEAPRGARAAARLVAARSSSAQQ